MGKKLTFIAVKNSKTDPRLNDMITTMFLESFLTLCVYINADRHTKTTTEGTMSLESSRAMCTGMTFA
jgi:hypothetical protein